MDNCDGSAYSLDILAGCVSYGCIKTFCRSGYMPSIVDVGDDYKELFSIFY